MLTENKKKFAEIFVNKGGFNPTETVKIMGIKTKSYLVGSRYMKDKEVKDYIKNLLMIKDKDTLIKSDDVVKFLSDCVRNTETEMRYFVLRSGDKEGYEETIKMLECPLTIKDRLKAAEIMAKIYKLMDTKLNKKTINLIIDSNVPLKNKVLDEYDDDE